MKKKSLLAIFTFLVFSIFFTIANNTFAAGETKTGKFVHWKGGSTWDYYTVGDFNINSLTLDDVVLDGRRVYCCEHEKRTPQDTTDPAYPSLTAKIYYPDTPGYNKKIATILYYGPGGEGEKWPLTDEVLVATSMALNRYVTGETRDGSNITRNAIYQELLRLADAEDCPDGTAYVMFEPEFSNFQITAAYVGQVNPTGTVVVEKSDVHHKLKAGAQFKLYNDKDTFTATTGENGKATFEEVPVGTYTIEEIKAPDGMINEITTRTTTLTVTKDNTTTYKKTDDYPRGGVKVAKYNKDRRTLYLGDAVLEGAVFELRAAEDISEGETKLYSKDDLVRTITTDAEGYTAVEKNIPLGKYYLVEIKASEGYLLNEERYDLQFNYVDENTPDVGTQTIEIPEEAIYGKVEVLKFENLVENSVKSPAEGVVLRLTRVDDSNEYYEATVDEYGYAEFINQEVKDLGYDSTIPYGEYTLEEKAGPDGNKYYFIQPVTIDISENNQVVYKIVSDNPVPVWLRVIKKDKETGNVVGLPGAEFEIYKTNGEQVSMKVAGSGEVISTYKTNEDGEFYSPRELYPGEYVIYETKAPEGYYLQDEWRKPTNTADIGNPEKGGKYIKIDKLTAGLEGDAVYPLGGVDAGEIVYETSLPDNPLYVNILIKKTAERLTGATQSTVTYIGAEGKVVELEKITPKYQKNIGLQGVKYKIYANKDIYKTNGELFANKDEEVDDITTDVNGEAQSRKDLIPGEYRVEEYEVPEGYLLDTTPTIVPLDNTDQFIESKTTKLELSDERQKLSLKFEKEFKESKYTTGDENKYAVFGIYTKEAIKNYQGVETIPSDKLIELITVEDNGMVKSTVDLPQGDYVVKELYAEFPYEKSSKTQTFSLRYVNDGKTKEVEKEGEKVINDYVSGTIHFIKLSTTVNDKLVISGTDTITEGLDEQAKAIMEELKGKSNTEIEQYFKDNPITSVQGAKYEIWLDEEGNKKVYETDATGNKKVAVFTTNGYGAIDISELPIGTFYLKEIEAPEGYEISEEVVKFELNINNSDVDLYQAIFDDSTKTQFLHKTDIFTGEDVAKCNFEIRDEDGNLILNSITGDDGIAWIPNDAFEPYRNKPETKFYYTEIDAPDVYKEDGKLYVLNTEPHEFTGVFDETGKFNVELTEVENLRPLTIVTIVKTDEEDNLVPNCKFELKSEEEGLYEKIGYTDENGIYVFENVPQGWYTYTELEAPEEYNIDTTPHRIYVTGEEIIIDFVNQKAPDTGDIPILAISLIALTSALGIAIITFKKM